MLDRLPARCQENRIADLGFVVSLATGRTTVPVAFLPKADHPFRGKLVVEQTHLHSAALLNLHVHAFDSAAAVASVLALGSQPLDYLVAAVAWPQHDPDIVWVCAAETEPVADLQVAKPCNLSRHTSPRCVHSVIVPGAMSYAPFSLHGRIGVRCIATGMESAE